MSWQAANWMDSLPLDVMKPLATRVLLKLANVAAQDGTRAYRNIWEVAEELGVDRRSVQRAYRELEAAELMHEGDQRVTAHIRADRRPKVYDLNFGYEREFGRPELPLPEEGEQVPAPEASEWTSFDEVTRLSTGERHGATELSTDSHGATYGAAAAVPLGTNRTNLTTFNETALVLEHARAHEGIKDASGGSLRGASAIATARTRWLGCGGVDRPHQPVADGSCCAYCGRRSPAFLARS